MSNEPEENVNPLTLSIDLATANLLIDALEIASTLKHGSDFAKRCQAQITSLRRCRELLGANP